jgi:Prenyltransferase and squalene oxidase repeat
VHRNAQVQLDNLNGWLGPDAYSTAWVATVPDIDNPKRPAWPQALDYLRSHQLEDGGWGEPGIYYAHERTISTLAAIFALTVWQETPRDCDRVADGLAALRRYATDLSEEPHAPIGFELLLPRLRKALSPYFEMEFPLEQWARIAAMGAEKLAILQTTNPDPTIPQAWWFSMEMLSEEQLSQLDDSLLDDNGSIVTSSAATAAYLRARRLSGADSPRAARYLSQLLVVGNGNVPVGWPFEVFERIWALDSLMRAGLDPKSRIIAETVKTLSASWSLNKPGFSYSDAFPINDGDDTLVGFTVLNWAGSPPSGEPILDFWDGDHFKAYLDERDPSASVNIHGLTALRLQPGFPNRRMAEKATEWLKAQITPDTIFDDKWHLSPFYLVAHALYACAGWDDTVTSKCIDFLFQHQRADGGWGWFGHSTLEETSHTALGLCFVFEQGLLENDAPLKRAAQFFQANRSQKPVERLWIGKTLYCPEGIVEVTLAAANLALERLGYHTFHQGDYLPAYSAID